MLKRLMFLSLLATACGGSDPQDPENPSFERRGETINFKNPELLDFHPALSDDGTKLIFISRRGEGRLRKVYKVDYSLADTTPTRLTDASLAGEEYSSAISPDGVWAAFFHYDGTNTKLFVQSFSDSSKRVEVTLPEGYSLNRDQVSFSPGANPLITFFVRNAENQENLAVVKVTGTADNPALSAATVTSSSTSEHHPKWVATGSGYGFMTYMNGGTHWLERTFTDEALAGMQTTEVGKGVISRGFEKVFAPSATHVAYVYENIGTAKKKNPISNKVLAEGAAKDEVVIANEARVFNRGAATETAIDSEHSEIRKLAITKDGRYVVVLGAEFYACQFREVWGTSLILYDTTTQQQYPRFFIKKSGESFVMETDVCANFIDGMAVEEKPIDMFLADIALAADAASGVLTLAYETYLFGDREVMLMNFKPTGSGITDFAVKEGSKNR